nr:hypothetical protein [uncultured Methanoregula sp.]
MHKDLDQNETNRKIDDSCRNAGSPISGLGHAAACTGCRSDATRKEQTTTTEPAGKPLAASQDPVPARRKKPLAAIREAKRRAAIWGFSVADVLSGDPLPYDLMAIKDGITSFICVRRVNASWFNERMIQQRCRNEIAAFRAMRAQQGLCFELWVRGYARAFVRYCVLPDTIEEIGMVLEPETRMGKKALEETMMNTTQPDTADETIAGDTS